MQIQQFLHTALNVTDLAKAEHFYSEILGLTRVDGLRPTGGHRDLKFPGLWYQIGPYQLHLIVAPENQASPNWERWGRNRHLAFAVPDVAAVKARLTAMGQDFQTSASGRPAVFVRDPDDNVIELGEM